MKFDTRTFGAGIVAGLLLAVIALHLVWWWAHWRVRRRYSSTSTTPLSTPTKIAGGWLHDDGSVTTDDGHHFDCDQVEHRHKIIAEDDGAVDKSDN
jgi:hypothetical protein